MNPCTKIPDADIKLENNIPGSPAFIPYQQKTPKNKGKGKGSKGPKIKVFSESIDMARTKQTLMKAKIEAIKARNKRADECAKQMVVETAKQAKENLTLKPRKTDPNKGKSAGQPLKAKAARKSASSGMKPTKPRCSWEMQALREIRCFQRGVDLLIPFLSFQRLVREVAQGFRTNLRFQRLEILALQEATEQFLVMLFESISLCAIHRKWQTIAPKDFHLVRQLWHIAGINLWWVS